MKAWLINSDGSATNNTDVRCRNKLAGMRTFGITETDFSNCVEFCQLHVDSSGNTSYNKDTLDSLLESRERSVGNANWIFSSAEVFSQDSQSCVPTPASTTTATTSSSWGSTTSTTSASARRFIWGFFQCKNRFSGRGRQQAKMSCYL